MSIVERYFFNIFIVFDIGGFFEMSIKIRWYLLENGNLMGNNFFVFVGWYVFGDSLNEMFFWFVVEYFLLKGMRGVKVFRMDFVEEVDSFIDKLIVYFVKVDVFFLEFDGFDIGEISGFFFLIVESYGIIVLKVVCCVRGGWLIDWKLLVVGINMVVVCVRVRE